jgi:hypothetical protein
MPRNSRSKSTTVKLEIFQDEVTPILQNFLLSSSRKDPGFSYLRDQALSKHPALTDSNDEVTRRKLAIAKLFDADARCKQINEEGYDLSHIEADVLNGLLKTAQSLIGNLLVGWEHLWLNDAMFSNGASMGHKLQDAAPYRKVLGKSTVTPSALPFALAAIKACPAWEDLMRTTYGDEAEWLDLVGGNGVFTVPKNAKIDRAAAKEPDMNMYLQKGIGSFIRRRLRTVGIDLNDQSKNKKLAQIGSIDNTLATLDLSSASDSVSMRLVWDLLPPSLSSYLEIIRSRRTKVDGQFISWSLFSSMGNGFTFELESLIFWALTKAVAIHLSSDTVISIYGDDIICCSSIAPLVIQTLRAVGFIINTDKSFISGPFRESCGGHYYNGIDITPFYVKKPITDVTRLILLANRLRGWCTVGGMSDPDLFPLWESIRDRIRDLGYSKLEGGCDLNSPYSLVTPGKPQMKLAPLSKRIKSSDLSKESHAKYVVYFHQEGEVIETRTSNRYRVTQNKEWWTSVPMFPQET